VDRPWHGACRMSPAGPLHVACRMWSVASCTSHDALHAACCTLHVVRYISHLARCMMHAAWCAWHIARGAARRTSSRRSRRMCR
jgi:hypothetical protein